LTQTETDDSLFKKYQEQFGPKARGKKIFNFVKKTLHVQRSKFDSFSCPKCMRICEIQQLLLHGDDFGRIIQLSNFSFPY